MEVARSFATKKNGVSKCRTCPEELDSDSWPCPVCYLCYILNPSGNYIGGTGAPDATGSARAPLACKVKQH